MFVSDLRCTLVDYSAACITILYFWHNDIIFTAIVTDGVKIISTFREENWQKSKE